jgi:hypothetical protein
LKPLDAWKLSLDIVNFGLVKSNEMSNNPFDDIKYDLQLLRSLVLEMKENQMKGYKEEDERLLSPLEACKLWIPNISKPTLHSWSERGWIPRHRIGGRIYYKKSEILAAITTCRKYSRKV